MRKKVLIISSVAGVLLLLAVGIVFSVKYLFRNNVGYPDGPDGLQIAPTPEATKTIGIPETGDVVHKGEYFEYIEYEDEYVRFEYPKGWKVNVKSGKITTPMDNGFDGVYSINIGGENGWGLSLVQAEGGFGIESTSVYNSKNNTIEYQDYTENTSHKYELSNLVFIKNIERLGVINIYPQNTYKDWWTSEVSQTSEVVVASETEKGIYELMHFLPSGEIIGGEWDLKTEKMRGQLGTSRDSLFYELNCLDVVSEKDADKCAEFINRFFDSADRVDGEYVIVGGTNSFLNVREKASKDSEVIGKLYDGEKARYVSENKDWYEVVYTDRTGWISKEFAKKTGGD